MKLGTKFRKGNKLSLLDQLKEQGYTVKITHGRSFTLPTQPSFFGTRKEHPAIPPNPQGGFTLATIRDADGNLLASGSTLCSKRDNYSKSLGAQIALGRAYCDLTGESERRRQRREEN